MSAETATDASGTAKRVLVTGASGRTGGIVFEKLLAKDGYATRGMVRSEQVGGNRLGVGGVLGEEVQGTRPVYVVHVE